MNGQVDACQVRCRTCNARGPLSDSERGAWDAWNARDVVDRARLDSHVRLCRRNLRSKRVACCASCPFEKLIVGHDAGMAPLFEAKRLAKGGGR